MASPSLLTISQLALEFHAAVQNVRFKKFLYHEAVRSHEEKNGRADGRINPLDPGHAGVISATAGEYANYQAARRSSYNSQRRLESACRRFQCKNQ